MSYYLAADLGTTGCRSILFDQELNIIVSEYEEYPLITPTENFVEQDAELWREMTFRTLKKVIKNSGVEGEDIKAISISSQGITIVPVNRELEPIYNAISWLDTRAQSETDQIRKDFGDKKIFSITGKPISSAYTLPKLLWIRKNLPEIYDMTYKFLMPMDYLIACLTGVCVTDYSMASGTLFYDLKNACWSKEILDFYGLPERKLPIITDSGAVAGTLLPKVAKELGLEENCVVAIGAQDQKCAAYGAGLKDGVITVSLGTAAAVIRLLENLNTDDNKGITLCGYTNKEVFVAEGVINTAGTCLRWIRDMLYKDEDYAVIDSEAAKARERGSSVLFYPHLAGGSSPDYYDDSTGVFYGLGLATGRGDLALAVMEGVAFGIRKILERMGAYENAEKVILFGGGAKGDFWASVITDITNLQVCVPVSFEAAGAGAAMLAAKASGVTLNPLKTDKTYSPERTDYYKEKYRKYIEIEKKIWEKDSR